MSVGSFFLVTKNKIDKIDCFRNFKNIFGKPSIIPVYTIRHGGYILFVHSK